MILGPTYGTLLPAKTVFPAIWARFQIQLKKGGGASLIVLPAKANVI